MKKTSKREAGEGAKPRENNTFLNVSPFVRRMNFSIAPHPRLQSGHEFLNTTWQSRLEKIFLSNANVIIEENSMRAKI